MQRDSATLRALRLSVGSASSQTRPGGVSVAAAAGILAGPILMLALRLYPRLDVLLTVPVQHLYIVSATSVLTALIASALAVAAMRVGLYRALFLALGFATMGALFAVHGLTTPGLLVANLFRRYAGSAVALSAYLSLAIPGIFFAAAQVPRVSRLERHMPFWPAGWLAAVVAVLTLGYAVVAIADTSVIAALPLSTPPLNWVIAVTGTVLLLYAAMRQWRAYRASHLETQAALAAAFALLAEAQTCQVLFRVWTMGWWEYHVLMLAAVALALRAMAVERSRGRSLRQIWDAQNDWALQLDEADVDTVAALVAAVEVKDGAAIGHNRRVAGLALRLGREMGMGPGELQVLARAGLLHDLGKLGIPDHILQKPGPLDDDEWATMRTHPELGAQIMTRTGGFQRELLAVLYHHERMDGSGYPHGLAGDLIPLEARILAVADTYDSLISVRPHRAAFSQEDAMQIVREESGTHLDPAIVERLEALSPAAPPAGR